MLSGALREFFFLNSEVLLKISLEAHPSVFCTNSRNVLCSGITIWKLFLDTIQLLSEVKLQYLLTFLLRLDDWKSGLLNLGVIWLSKSSLLIRDVPEKQGRGNAIRLSSPIAFNHFCISVRESIGKITGKLFWENN